MHLPPVIAVLEETKVDWLRCVGVDWDGLGEGGGFVAVKVLREEWGRVVRYAVDGGQGWSFS